MTHTKWNIEDWKSKTIWTAILMSIAILLVLSVQRKMKMPIEKISIHINKIDGKRNLISKKDIKSIFINKMGYTPNETNLRDMDLSLFEQTIKNDSRVEDADAYLDANGILNVIVKQRQPIMRVKSDDGDYYLDVVGNRINVREKQAIRVPVVTGKVSEYKADFLSKKSNSSLKSVYELCHKIKSDDFLVALIEQVHVKSSTQMYLIPKLGRQRISLNPTEDLDDKLFNLKVFYKDGLPREGWSKFAELKIDFKGQIVGVKEL